MNYTEFFTGKKVTIMGLGLLGRGVGDAAFIAQHGGIVTASDMKSAADLAESVAALDAYPVTFHLGGHLESDFTDADMVIKAAGVPLDSPYINAARAAGVPVYMSTALAAKFAREAGATIVGVTGTRGKSTVSHMIHHALSAAGRRTHLGGNVRGISTLSLVPAIREGDVVVLELDSWQLQGFGDLRFSPHVAVFTNLMPDHQNYYPDMDAYFADKANIFRYQKAGDALVVGADVAERVRAAAPPAGIDTPAPLPAEWQLRIPGEHNRRNAALAAAALRALKLAEPEIKAGLESFGGVAGRLQLIREVNGVRLYNDNNATTPEATIAAIRALDTGKKDIILIMGGSDKGLDMSALWREIQEKCKDVYFLVGSGIDRIRPEAPHVPAFDSIEEAVATAMQGAASGDILLFSPAFASFGMFKNEYDRNDRFVAAVESL
jgi:UDP-N-acetylmuramoylalanine--D-glutamate ligase